MTKRAVIVAINDYSSQPPTDYFSWPNLGGCLSDAVSLESLLKDAFVFDETTVLTDAQATRETILSSVRGMLDASTAGDVAAFCYAGHGGRLPSNPDDMNDPANFRFYDCIVPYSGDYITDRDFAELAGSLDPSTVNFTLVMDSCHSGGLSQASPDSRIRSGPYSDDLVATCVNLMDTVIPCGAVVPLGSSDFDGNVSQVTGDGNGIVCSVDDDKSFVAAALATVLAACRYDEVDADNAGGRGHGGLTQALLDVVSASNLQITHRALVDSLRDDMANSLGIAQTPTLLGQQSRMDEYFLSPWSSSTPG